MEHHVIEETKTVYFRGKWPSVMAIPHIMKRYPGYESIVLSWDDYMKLYG